MSILASFSDQTEEALLKFLRRETPRMSTLRRVVVTPTKVEVQDVNRNGLTFPGLSFGHPLLEPLMKEVGASFDPEALKEPPPNPNRSREFIISARYPWAHDRIA